MILGVRAILGAEAFDEWGWRIPFLISALLLAISLWIRLKLNESPAFQRMEAEQPTVRAPYRESFGTWRNLRLVLVALFGIMIAQGAVWYCGYFYTRFFMERVLKVETATVDALILAITVTSAFLYVFFGWLSDRVGRKPVMLFGMILALVSFFPGFKLLTSAANPVLAEAQATSPVVVVADPAACSVQFDPVGRTAFTSSCDIAKNVLSNAGVPYSNEAAPAGSVAQVRVGQEVIASVEGSALSGEALAAARADVQARITAALAGHGYPTAADPAQVNIPVVFGVLFVFIVAATALYGPQAAALVELFPTRIRYTAMSLPYNIGTGWVGGLLPAASFALVAWSGDIYFGLWYAVAFTLVAVVISIFFLPETRGRDLDAIETEPAASRVSSRGRGRPRITSRRGKSTVTCSNRRSMSAPKISPGVSVSRQIEKTCRSQNTTGSSNRVTAPIRTDLRMASSPVTLWPVAPITGTVQRRSRMSGRRTARVRNRAMLPMVY